MLMPPIILEELQCLADCEACCDNDDFNAFDYSGGNFDDAYRIGFQDAERILARRFLEIIKEYNDANNRS